MAHSSRASGSDNDTARAGQLSCRWPRAPAEAALMDKDGKPNVFTYHQLAHGPRIELVDSARQTGMCAWTSDQRLARWSARIAGVGTEALLADIRDTLAELATVDAPVISEDEAPRQPPDRAAGRDAAAVLGPAAGRGRGDDDTQVAADLPQGRGQALPVQQRREEQEQHHRRCQFVRRGALAWFSSGRR